MKQQPQDSPLYLDKRPKVQVAGLNKLAILFGVLMIMLVVGVIIFSTTSQEISQNPSFNTDNINEAEHTPPPELKKISHSIPGHKSQRSVKNTLPTTKTTQRDDDLSTPEIQSQEKSDLDKGHNQLLMEALNSPLNASIENHISSETTSSPASSRTPSNDTNDFPPPFSSHLQNQNSDQNRQQEKEAFLRALKEKLDNNTLQEHVISPHSPFQLMAGSQIPAITASGINSDLPGQFTALVRQNVFDTVSGRYLLIPQGSKLIMLYDSQLSFGQERVLVAAKRIIFPNGQSLNLQGMPGTDAEGFSGFHDEVNNHYFKLFGSSLMLGFISAGFQLSQPQQSSALQNPSSGQTLAGAIGQQLGEVSSQMMQKNLNIQPTLQIRPGYIFNVTVTSDIVLQKAYSSTTVNRS